MSTEQNDAPVLNKYTNRYLKKGTRGYVAYLKKVQREIEDEKLVRSQMKKNKKRAILVQAGMLSDSDSDNDNEGMPRPPLKRSLTGVPAQKKKKTKPNARDALRALHDTLEGIDETTTDSDDRLLAMFGQLLGE
jgi:hypothetical protein